MSRTPDDGKTSPMNRSESIRKDLHGKPRATLLVGLALLLLCLLPFGETVHHGFFNVDDDENITGEPAVCSGLTLRGAVWAFTHTQARRWAPLATLSRQADCQIFGLRAGGHHLDSLLLHALASFLLFLALRSLTGSFTRSALVAALFAVHPLHVEPVAWLSCRGELLCGIFFLLGLWSYSSTARRPSVGGRALLLLCFVLGCMSKPTMIAFPVVLLLLDYWPLGRLLQPRDLPPLVAEKLPLFLIGLLTGLTALFSEKPIPTPWNHLPLTIRMENDLVALVSYPGRMFWPAGLTYGYPIPKQGPGFLTALAAGIVLSVMGGAALRLRKRHPYLVVGFLWYLVTLAPVLAIVQLNITSYGDRYAYLPMVGVAIASVWLIADLTAPWKSDIRNRLRMTVALLVLGILTTLSFLQTRWWRDSLTLWCHTLDCTGKNAIAQANIAKILGLQGRYQEALEAASRAVTLEPIFADAHLLAGVANFYLGRSDEAISECRLAIRLRPDFPNYRIALGEALLRQGRTEEAVAEYREALRIQPDVAEWNNVLGVLLIRQGRAEEAVAHFREASRLDPGNREFQGNLQKALLLREAPSTTPLLHEGETAPSPGGR
jgi:protein O-mannosyl-transferase